MKKGDAQANKDALDELVPNPFAAFEDHNEPTIPSATLQIYQFIEKYLERKEETNVLRASAATMCVRRRWYQASGYKGTPLTPRKMVNFMLGDLSERTLLYFIKQALVGPGKLYSEVDFGQIIGSFQFQNKPIDLHVQKTMSFNIGAIIITGHADGFGKRNSDGQWELIECKSAADFGFDKFIDYGPGDYLKQAHALMLTEDCKKRAIKQVRFFYLKKNTGNLYDRVFDFDPILADLVIKEFQQAHGINTPEKPYSLIPETHYRKPTGRITCVWQCAYCPFTKECHGEFETEWKNGRPKYIWKKEKADGI